jgi:hypothetical protein
MDRNPPKALSYEDWPLTLKAGEQDKRSHLRTAYFTPLSKPIGSQFNNIMEVWRYEQ